MDDRSKCATCGQQAFTQRYGSWTCSITCEARMLAGRLMRIAKLLDERDSAWEPDIRADLLAAARKEASFDERLP